MLVRTVDSIRMQKAIGDVVDRCLASNEMPEVGIHFSRLQSEGHSIESARAMIGAVLVTHIYLAKKKGTSIDYDALKSELARLPRLRPPGDVHQIDIRGIDESTA